MKGKDINLREESYNCEMVMSSAEQQQEEM